MSSEVGSGHVSIFPVMPGFKSKVTKETQSAGAAGAKAFSGGFKGAGTLAGRALGKDLKSALSSQAGDLGAAELRKLTGEVASASAALAKARLKQQDDAGRVRVAEARLAEAIEKSGAGSSQAIAAEERLASVRRVHAATTDAVTAASLRLKGAQDSLRKAQDAAVVSSVVSSGGVRQLARDFRAGLTDANAARSAFIGVAGSVGGLIRAVSDVTGLTHLGRLLRLSAQQAYTSFTSLASTVGGGLARAWSATSGWAANVGRTVGAALAPAGRVAANVGRTIATPFVQLGSRVASWMSPVTTQVSGLFSKVAASAGPAFSRITASVRSLAGPLGAAASSSFQTVVDAAGRAASAAGRALGSGIQSAATAGVTVAAAGIGVAFGKGLARLTSIDTAQAKLRGLGNDAESVTAIMGDALASVRGTSFGLGEAATVAASAVAAGIRPGEALQGHLKRIANNASAAGMSMEEMGSIFNKAATQANGVQNDVISQLADKGIPIYQALADQMGVTAGEVFKMASEGKVDFETFSRAAEAAAGTVADEMGRTVPGAAKNFFAAMGRIGANALQGIYGKIGPLIQAATAALGPIEERAKAFGDVLLRIVGPAMDWVTGLFNRIAEGGALFTGALSGMSGLIGPLAGVLVAIGSGGLAGILARLGPLAAMLGPLGGLLGALASPLGIAAAAFAGLALSGGDLGDISVGVTELVGNVVSALPGLISTVVGIIPTIVSELLARLPLLISLGAELIGTLVQGLVTAVPMLAMGALTLLQGLIGAIVSNLPVIITTAIQLVTTLIQGIVQAVPMLVQAALQLVTGLLTAIVAALPMIIEGGIQLLLALVMGIVGALPTLLQAALGLVMGLLDAIISNLPMIIDAGIQLLLSLVTGLIDALPQLITAAIELVLQLVVGLLTMLPKLIEAGIQLVVSLITGLVKAIPQIIAMLPQIVTAIWDGLAGVDWLGLGAQIIQGIIDGFFSMVGAVGDAIGSVVGGILDFFPHSPAKKGPLSAPGWRRLKSSGAATMEQFIAGAEGKSSAFGDALSDVALSSSTRLQALANVGSSTVAAAVAERSRPDSTSASASREGSERPIYMEGRLFGWLREMANGEARIVLDAYKTEQRQASARGFVGGV